MNLCDLCANVPKHRKKPLWIAPASAEPLSAYAEKHRLCPWGSIALYRTLGKSLVHKNVPCKQKGSRATKKGNS